MNFKAFPHGVFVGKYKGVRVYVSGGQFQFLLGWIPQEKVSLHAAKCTITRWVNSGKADQLDFVGDPSKQSKEVLTAASQC